MEKCVHGNMKDFCCKCRYGRRVVENEHQPGHRDAVTEFRKTNLNKFRYAQEMMGEI